MSMDDALAPPPVNVTLSPRELHMEVMDPRSMDVWLCQAPVTFDQYRIFKPDLPYVKSGLARAAMDDAWFLRSPGADADGALETRSIGGYDFVRVARSLDFSGLAKGGAPTRVAVDKHHIVGFRAGTKVRLVQLPDGGWYVQQTVASPNAEPIPLPGDWTLSEITLTANWTVRLPNPTIVWFFRNFDSYSGPIEPPL